MSVDLSKLAPEIQAFDDFLRSAGPTLEAVLPLVPDGAIIASWVPLAQALVDRLTAVARSTTALPAAEVTAADAAAKIAEDAKFPPVGG